MRWIVLGMLLVTALIVALAVIAGTGSGKHKRERAPRVPKAAALVLDWA
jgi:hypothetical protein